MIRRRVTLAWSIRNATRLAWAVVVVGCAARAPGAVARPAAVSGTGGPRLEFALITLERKPCFGTCAVYTVSIAGDGSLVFDGRAHVDSVRFVSSHIDADRVAALARLFDESEFATLDDRYVNGERNCRLYAADAPVVITSITIRDRVKRVEHDVGCANVPQRLTDLERRIDEIVGTSRWIGHR